MKRILIFILVFAFSCVEKEDQNTHHNVKFDKELTSPTTNIVIKDVSESNEVVYREGNFKIQFIDDDGTYSKLYYGTYNNENPEWLNIKDGDVLKINGCILCEETDNGMYFCSMIGDDNNVVRTWKSGTRPNLSKPDYPEVFDVKADHWTVITGQPFILIEKEY